MSEVPDFKEQSRLVVLKMNEILHEQWDEVDDEDQKHVIRAMHSAFAAGRMAGMRQGVNIVERALLCTGRGVFGDGVKAGCKYIRDELTKQIAQAAQE